MYWLLGIAGLYALLLWAVAWFSLHPIRTPLFVSPGFMGSDQEDVSFTTRDGKVLRAWWMAGPTGSPVAVLAHGYMMNRSELTPLAVWLWKQGFSCLLFDHRAHGKSSGKKTGLGYHEKADVAAAVKWVRGRMPNSKVLLVGSSMGAAASAMAMAEDPSLADSAIFDSAYGNFANAIGGWWEFLGNKTLRFFLTPVLWFAWPMAGYNPFAVDLPAIVKDLDGSRLLWIHGSQDVLATPKQAKRNIEATTPNGKALWMAGCDHAEGRWVHPQEYFAGVQAFLQDQGLLPSPVPGP